MPRSRNFSFTYHITEDIPEPEENLLSLDTKYIIYQYEKAPNTGAIHIQGFMVFENKKTFAHIHHKCPEIWVQSARASALKNINYCSKADTRVAGPYEHGERPNQGHRSDLKVALDRIKEGKSFEQVIEEFPGTSLFTKALQVYQSVLIKRPKDFVPKVFIRWGPSGSGKTRWAYDNYETVFALEYEKQGAWWDGYANEKCILIDDWPLNTAEEVYNWLLRWTDRYPVKTRIKGAMINLSTSDIVITSNHPPAAWFGGRGLQALERRVTSVVHVV